MSGNQADTESGSTRSRLAVACLLLLAASEHRPMDSTQLLEAARPLALVDETSLIPLNTLFPLTQLLVSQDASTGTVELIHTSLCDYINSHRMELEAYLPCPSR